jgi:hypothetical protein
VQKACVIGDSPFKRKLEHREKFQKACGSTQSVHPGSLEVWCHLWGQKRLYLTGLHRYDRYDYLKISAMSKALQFLQKLNIEMLNNSILGQRRT